MDDIPAAEKLAMSLADELLPGLKRAADWHEHRARCTPDVFEQEFHEVSARNIRTLTAEPDTGAALSVLHPNERIEKLEAALKSMARMFGEPIRSEALKALADQKEQGNG